MKLQSILQRWVACTLDLEVADKELAELYKPQNVAMPITSSLLTSVWPGLTVASIATMPKP